MGDLTEHFSRKEFACKCGCGADKIDLILVMMLEDVRKAYGKPMTITSGVRCPVHNAQSGGKLDSAHLTGWAADIACPSSGDRFELLKAMLAVGFKRVGIAKDFLHVDIDSTKPMRVVWLY